MARNPLSQVLRGQDAKHRRAKALAQLGSDANVNTPVRKRSITQVSGGEMVDRNDQVIAVSQYRRQPLLSAIQGRFGLFWSARERALFFRQFATMFDAGIPLVQGLAMIGRSGEPAIQEKMSAAVHFIESGHQVSEGLQLTKLFTPLQIALIQSGERSGKLSHILLTIAAAEEGSCALRDRTKGKLVYPLCVLLLCWVTLSGVLYGVGKVQRSINFEPTTLHPTLAFFFGMLAHPAAPWITLGLPPFLLLMGFLLRKPLARWLDYAPASLHRVLDEARVAGWCRLLAMLLETGVPLATSLEWLGEVILPRDSEQILRSVKAEGKTLAESLTSRFTPMVCTFVEVGEETGALPVLLKKAAELLELDFLHRLEIAIELIDPLISAILGLVVAGICLLVLLPMVGNL